MVCDLHQTRILSGRESAYCSLCDPQSMDPKVDNLTVLDDLNENSLLNILRTRFRKDMIYSNIGTILVSVNPFKPLPLYTPQQVMCALVEGGGVVVVIVVVVVEGGEDKWGVGWWQLGWW